jgi:hypothetical protein
MWALSSSGRSPPACASASARKQRLNHLAGDARLRVLGDAAPGVEKKLSAFAQHAPRLAIGSGLLGDEHDPERAYERRERGVGKGQRHHVGLSPLNADSAELAPRGLDHRRRQIRGDDAPRCLHPLAKLVRQDAGPAGKFQYVPTWIRRQPAAQFGRDRFELGRAEDAVVVL